MSTYKTKQEEFWAGEFGQEYMTRNKGDQFIEIAKHQFSKCFASIPQPKSIIEFGSNIGNNIEALSELYKNTDLAAIELNNNASEILKRKNICKVFNTSILNYQPEIKYEIAFTCGVLIHISPSELQNVYEKLYNASNKYILLIEYYNHKVEEIDYRGHSEKLFRRDFSGEFLNKYPDSKLMDYGFLYHRDTGSPRKEDIHWFLIEK